ncbi:MAG TPA: DUF484 family protein [Steroidobacteraceae bacterium]|jgi:hypothetical protein
MSSNQVRGLSEEGLDEESVTQFLQQNPEFFERHPQLLARLRLHHPRNGTTVSLIERQVEVLRDKYQAQEQKLTEFVRVARANNVLADKIHRFTCRLLKTTTRAAAIVQIEASLREDFDTFHALLLLTAAEPAGEAASAQRFVRHVGSEDAVFRSFDALFATCKPRCGQLRDSQRDYLFGSEAAGIGSVALVPLGGHPALGLLALGSVDQERFHPGMSTEFLSRIGELVTEALSRD